MSWVRKKVLIERFCNSLCYDSKLKNKGAKMSLMKFELEDEYIELFKLLKVLDLVDTGAQAKMIVADGYVTRNGEVETRKRAKIIAGDSLVVGGDVSIDVVKKI